MKLYFDYRDPESYLKLFSQAKSAKILGESSDHYLCSQVAAQEIHQFNPEAKIIIFLREPVSFLRSLHNHFVKVTNEEEEDFIKALALEKDRVQGKAISPRIMCPSWAHYSQRINYYEQIKRYYDHFNSEQIKVVVYEDFRANNHQVYQEILRFIEVDPNFIPEYKSMNVSKEVRFKQLNYLINNQVIKNITKKVFSQAFLDFVRVQIVERFLWKPTSESTEICEEFKKELQQKFKSEVIKTSDLIGIDLTTKWGYN